MGIYKKCLCVISGLFFAGMLFLTLEAREIHESSLPCVVAKRLPIASVGKESAMEDGEIPQTFPVFSEELFEQKEWYLLTEREKNGETRTFVKKADVVFGEKTAEGYPVLSGISPWDLVVTQSDEILFDGVEVRVKN